MERAVNASRKTLPGGRTAPELRYRFISRLAALPFVEAVWLYGSRARGDNGRRSDIDLAVVCPRASAADWQRVLDIIEDADTLLGVDCVRFDALPKDGSLKKQIAEEKVVLSRKERA